MNNLIDKINCIEGNSLEGKMRRVKYTEAIGEDIMNIIRGVLSQNSARKVSPLMLPIALTEDLCM